MQPNYDEATRVQAEREAAQQPFRAQFVTCKTLDALAATIKKAKRFHTAPWVSWICNAEKKWCGAKKPDATKQKKLAAILKDLIVKGAELALVDENERRSRHALASVLACEELTIKQRVQLLELAIAHGANPAARVVYPQWASETGPFAGYYVTPSALDVALAEPAFLDAIRPHVSAEALADAELRRAVAQLSSRDDEAFAIAGNLDRLVTKLDDTQTAALVHFACGAEVAPSYLERIVDQVDVDFALAAPQTFQVPVYWGVVPTVRVPAGGAALDVIDAILGFATRARTSQATTPLQNFRAEDTDAIIERATAKRATLVARGAHKRVPVEFLDLPANLGKTAEQLLRLAKLRGIDTGPLHAAMASVDTGGMGPWGFLRAVVPPFEAALIGALDAPPLVALLSTFSTDRYSNQLTRSALPDEQRAGVDIAIAYHEADGAQMLAVKTARGTEIWRLENDEVTVLAPTVGDYLAAEIDRWQA